MSNEWELIPDDVIETARYAALDAAREVLSTLRGIEDPSFDEITRTILRAFTAVHDVAIRSEADFCSRHPGHKYASFTSCFEAHHIVATALAFKDNPSFAPNPLSLGGAYIVNFANVCKALDALSNATVSLRSGEMCGAEHAKGLLIDAQSGDESVCLACGAKHSPGQNTLCCQ